MVSKILVMESNVLMTDSKIMSVSFRAQRRGDVEPPSEAECATTSPRVRQSARRRAPECGESAFGDSRFGRKELRH
jgi:hypothetical protein